MTKKPWLSKTLWTNLILTLAAIAVPTVNQYLVAHPETFVIIFAVANAALRLITKEALSFED